LEGDERQCLFHGMCLSVADFAIFQNLMNTGLNFMIAKT